MRRIMKRRHNAMNAERIVAKGAGNREKKNIRKRIKSEERKKRERKEWEQKKERKKKEK